MSTKMACCLSQASATPHLSTQQISPINAPLHHHISARTCNFKCYGLGNAKDNTSIKSSETKQRKDGTEPENVVLKVAWYASELLGIAASALRPPSPNDATDEYQELATVGSGRVDRAVVVETIKQDFQRSYFVTGNLTLGAYEEDCEFADPAGSFKGLRRFKRNCTNFGSLIRKSNMKLMKWEDFEDKGIGHWRFSCVLSFPWRPILSATGYTEYYFDHESGKVCRHIENWNVPKMTLLKQILKPSRLGDR
ncbi:hypothetical protein RND81_02G126000 [Saponaria officinalis]|uniref:Uncharacterized protein n=1 Tax=Saponaria officinalis TaxID=3572 RepID=A0AAW1MTP3_SAPOF